MGLVVGRRQYHFDGVPVCPRFNLAQTCLAGVYVENPEDTGANYSGEGRLAAGRVDPSDATLFVGRATERDVNLFPGDQVGSFTAVAAGIDVWIVGAKPGINRYRTGCADLDAGGPGQTDIRGDAGGKHDQIGLQFEVANEYLLYLELSTKTGHPTTGHDRNALLFELLFHQERHFWVQNSGQELITHFNHRHYHAGLLQSFSGFQADQSAAYDTGCRSGNGAFFQQCCILDGFDSQDA